LLSTNQSKTFAINQSLAFAIIQQPGVARRRGKDMNPFPSQKNKCVKIPYNIFLITETSPDTKGTYKVRESTVRFRNINTGILFKKKSSREK